MVSLPATFSATKDVAVSSADNAANGVERSAKKAEAQDILTKGVSTASRIAGAPVVNRVSASAIPRRAASRKT
jgi:hypothetical protein